MDLNVLIPGWFATGIVLSFFFIFDRKFVRRFASAPDMIAYTFLFWPVGIFMYILHRSIKDDNE